MQHDARRDKQKQRAEMANQLESQNQKTETGKRPVENPRRDKLADFLIDVAKYVFTGVIITSLFNDVSDKTILYLVGMFIVVVSLALGLRLTNKRKD